MVSLELIRCFTSVSQGERVRKWLAQVPSVLRREAGNPCDSGRAFPGALHPRTGLSKGLRVSTNRAKSREGASAEECRKRRGERSLGTSEIASP